MSNLFEGKNQNVINSSEQILFSGGNRKLNENWKIQQKTFRAAIAAARKG